MNLLLEPLTYYQKGENMDAQVGASQLLSQLAVLLPFGYAFGRAFCAIRN